MKTIIKTQIEEINKSINSLESIKSNLVSQLQPKELKKIKFTKAEVKRYKSLLKIRLVTVPLNISLGGLVSKGDVMVYLKWQYEEPSILRIDNESEHSIHIDQEQVLETAIVKKALDKYTKEVNEFCNAIEAKYNDHDFIELWTQMDKE